MAERDPFDDLRLPQVPLAVDPAFAARLRRRLEDALSPDRPPIQEVAMSDTATTTTTTSTLVPYLSVDGAAAAIDWYRDVFGAIETMRFVGDDGRVGHAEITIGDANLMLADEYPEMDVRGPQAFGGTAVMLHLDVVDVDHTYARAMDGGATSVRPPSDQFHGNRNASIVDPFGHKWMLSQPIDAERAAAAEEADPGNGSFVVTGRTPVEPGYLVIHAADVDRTTAFFGELFGWQPEPGAQGAHIANTRFPLGIASDDGGPSTSVYFRVDDIEPYAARVVELGGRVIERNDHPSGGNAACEDDQGYRFDLWKPAPGY